MMDWSWSQWIIIPLIVLGDLLVALGILGMLVYMLSTLRPGRRVPVSEAESGGTPNLPFKAFDLSWVSRKNRRR